ncbi:MAG: hypothetical protein ACI8UR_001232 [Natronomonas sp.]|jgi:hypothetical protein|uniref:hypothetical protein n=1 Tax=Natronomonas sp. TaxID=2184060 RepID=UPI00398A20A7
MRSDRAVIALTIVLLLGATLVSGPLVGISLTETETFAPGSGTANVTVEEVPRTATLSPAEYEGGPYTLHIDPARVRVQNVSGQPTVAYSLTVPGLNHSRSSVTFLDDGYAGQYDLTFSPSTLEQDRVNESRAEYTGVARVYVYDEAGDRLLIEQTIEIEVKQ